MKPRTDPTSTAPDSGLGRLGTLSRDQLPSDLRALLPDTERSPDTECSWDLLVAALLTCGDQRSVPQDFEAATRHPLGVVVRGWRQAGLDEGELSERFGRLGDLIVKTRLAPGSRRSQKSEGLDRARAAGAVMDGVQILARRAERTFRSWRERFEAEAAVSAAIYADVLGNELRNRLHAASTALDLLETDTLSPEHRLRLEGLLLAAIQAAIASADDIRWLSGEESATRRPALPLADLLQRTVQQIAAFAGRRRVELQLHGTPPHQRVDPRPVQVLLYNLLTTVIERAAKLSTSDPRVDLAARSTDDGLVELVMTSNAQVFGDGEDAAFEVEVLDLVSTDEGEELSLWLTREAVDYLGGSLELESDPGHGTTIRVTFPSPTAKGEDRASHRNTGAARMSPMRGDGGRSTAIGDP